MRRLGAVLLVLGLIVLVGAPSASALTRKKADKVAVKALSPSKQPGVAVLFGLPKALKKGSVVAEAGGSKLKPFKLKGKGWLYWLDREYAAFFVHRSTVLVVDDKTGKVRFRKHLGWYPLVNGKRPAFLSTRAGYQGTRYRVAANVKSSSSASRPARARVSQVTKQDLANDCMITVGDQKEPILAGSFTAMEKWADSVGLARSQRRAETLTDLEAAVEGFTSTTSCNDIFIFLAGHGTPAPGVPIRNRPPGRPPVPNGAFGPARVATRTATRGSGQRNDYITPADLKALMDSKPNITFKIKIESCYAGRFKDELQGKVPNLRVLEASSASDEVSFGETKRYPDANRTMQTNQTPNPEHAGEFTNANVIGLTQWATSATETGTYGSDLERGIARAGEIAMTKDFGQVQGRTHGQIYTNFPPPKEEFFATWTHGNSTSTLCIYVRGVAGQTGDVTITGTAPTLDSPVKPFKLDAQGRRLVTFLINSATKYTFHIRRPQPGGTFRTEESGETTVAAPPTNGPAPPAGSDPPACPAPA